MKILHTIENRVCVVTIDGQLADSEVKFAETYMQPILNDESFNALIIDLDKVVFIDSAGLGLLAITYDKLKKREARFALYHVTKKNKEILKLTHLDRILKVYSTKTEAIAAL